MELLAARLLLVANHLIGYSGWRRTNQITTPSIGGSPCEEFDWCKL